MCFSAEISLATFLVGEATALLLVLTTKNLFFKVFGLFLMFVASMQGIEYLLWRHQVCDSYNRTISFTGMLLNHAQPFVLGMILLGFVKRAQQNASAILALLLIYSFAIVPYSLQFFKEEALQCSVKEGNPYLLWGWNNLPNATPLYTLFILVLAAIGYFGMPRSREGILFAGLAGGSFLFSYFLYPRPFVGSLWCFFTALFPAVLLGMDTWRSFI